MIGGSGDSAGAGAAWPRIPSGAGSPGWRAMRSWARQRRGTLVKAALVVGTVRGLALVGIMLWMGGMF